MIRGSEIFVRRTDNRFSTIGHLLDCDNGGLIKCSFPGAIPEATTYKVQFEYRNGHFILNHRTAENIERKPYLKQVLFPRLEDSGDSLREPAIEIQELKQEDCF